MPNWPRPPVQERSQKIQRVGRRIRHYAAQITRVASSAIARSCESEIPCLSSAGPPLLQRSARTPVSPTWGSLNSSIGNSADGKGFTVIASTPDADNLLNVSAKGTVDLLLRKDWTEERLKGPMVSPDGIHLAFATWAHNGNAWMIENF